MQANKVCQLGQDVCSAGNTFEKIAEGCRRELKARKSAVQLCDAVKCHKQAWEIGKTISLNQSKDFCRANARNNVGVCMKAKKLFKDALS